MLNHRLPQQAGPQATSLNFCRTRRRRAHLSTRAAEQPPECTRSLILAKKCNLRSQSLATSLEQVRGRGGQRRCCTVSSPEAHTVQFARHMSPSNVQ